MRLSGLGAIARLADGAAGGVMTGLGNQQGVLARGNIDVALSPWQSVGLKYAPGKQSCLAEVGIWVGFAEAYLGPRNTTYRGDE